VASVQLSHSSLSMPVGGRQTVFATAYNTGGSPVSARFQWTSGNQAVVVVEVSEAESDFAEIVAVGPGSATVTVRTTAPPPPPPAPTKVFSEELSRRVQDAYFDYDKSDIRDDARATLTSNSDALKTMFREFPNSRVVVEGHCDERGSAEYNLGLGDRRATSAKEFLTTIGVPADRISVISYGKERPQCTEGNESCWQRNRRVHFVAGN